MSNNLSSECTSCLQKYLRGQSLADLLSVVYYPHDVAPAKVNCIHNNTGKHLFHHPLCKLMHLKLNICYVVPMYFCGLFCLCASVSLTRLRNWFCNSLDDRPSEAWEESDSNDLIRWAEEWRAQTESLPTPISVQRGQTYNKKTTFNSPITRTSNHPPIYATTENTHTQQRSQY